MAIVRDDSQVAFGNLSVFNLAMQKGDIATGMELVGEAVGLVFTNIGNH